MIQTTAPISAGSSGAALLDDSGALIGVMTAVRGDEPGSGFAVPIDLVHRVAEQLLASGEAQHCWLGVEGADLPTDQAILMRIAGGAVVQRVATRSPAAAVGLAPSDVITEIDDTDIRSVSNLVVQLRSHAPGDRVVVGYWRAGRHSTVRVTLGARP